MKCPYRKGQWVKCITKNYGDGFTYGKKYKIIEVRKQSIVNELIGEYWLRFNNDDKGRVNGWGSANFEDPRKTKVIADTKKLLDSD